MKQTEIFKKKMNSLIYYICENGSIDQFGEGTCFISLSENREGNIILFQEDLLEN